MYTGKIYQTNAHYLYTIFQSVALCSLVPFHIPDGMNADALGMHALGMLGHGMLRKYARRRTEAPAEASRGHSRSRRGRCQRDKPPGVPLRTPGEELLQGERSGGLGGDVPEGDGPQRRGVCHR